MAINLIELCSCLILNLGVAGLMLKFVVENWHIGSFGELS